MTQQDYRHPIAPPPELAMQWIKQLFDNSDDPVQSGYLLIKVAAQYGADQELEAGVRLAREAGLGWFAVDLMRARRPKPLSLKEQALEILRKHVDRGYLTDESSADADTIRRALEQLDD